MTNTFKDKVTCPLPGLRGPAPSVRAFSTTACFCSCNSPGQRQGGGEGGLVPQQAQGPERGCQSWIKRFSAALLPPQPQQLLEPCSSRQAVAPRAGMGGRVSVGSLRTWPPSQPLLPLQTLGAPTRSSWAPRCPGNSYAKPSGPRTRCPRPRSPPPALLSIRFLV